MNNAPQVYHIHDPHPVGSIYVGRPTKFGNPFKVSDSGRTSAVDQFREHAFSNPEYIQMVREELAGKNLLCWCRTTNCHAHVLLEIANSPDGFF